MNSTPAKSPLSRLHQWLLACLFLVYFFLGMTFLVERWAKTQVGEWQDLISAYLTQKTGLEWSIQGLSLDYRRLNPIVSVDKLRANVAVSDRVDKPVTVVAVDSGEVYIDLARSLLHRQLMFYGVQAQQVEVVIERQGNRWAVAGFPSIAGQSTRYDFLTLLDTLRYFNVSQLKFAQRLDMGAGPVVTSPPGLGLRYARRDQQRQFELLGRSETEGQHSILHVVSQGVLRPGQYALKVYGASRENRLGQWANAFFGVSDVVDLDIELAAYQPVGQQLRGSLTVNRASINLSHRDDEQAETKLAIANVEAGFGQYADGLWKADWPSFIAQQGQQQLAIAAGEITYSRDSDNQPLLHLAVPELNLGLITELLTGSRMWTLLLGEQAHSIVKQLNLDGFVNNVNLTLPLNVPENFELVAAMRDAAIDSFRGAPAGFGINGKLRLTAYSGSVELAGNDTSTLTFPKTYAQPLQVQSLQGNVDWVVKNGRAHVIAPALHFGRPDDEGRYAAALALNLGVKKRDKDSSQNEAGTMALSISSESAEVDSLLALVPEVAPVGLANWLDASDATGNVVTGSFIYNGSLRGSEKDRRTVSLLLDLKNAGLTYLPGWPGVSEANARLAIHNNTVSAEIPSARLQSMDVSNIHVGVRPVSDEMVLNIAADFSGEAGSIVELLQSAPVGQKINELFKPWSATGALEEGKFSLSMPLQGAALDNMALAASANLREAGFALADLGLEFTEINGRLGYSLADNMTSKNLTAKLWGENIDVVFGAAEQGADMTEFSASGLVDIDQLERWLDQPLLNFATGKTPVALNFSAGPDKTHLSVRSQLQGVGVDLPVPLTKRANEDLPLLLDWHLSGEDQPMRLQLGSRALMMSNFNEGRMSGVTVALSDRNDSLQGLLPKGPITSGALRLNAHFSQFDTALWFPVIEQYTQLLDKKALANKGSQPHTETETLHLSGSLLLDSARAFDISFGESKINIGESYSRWNIDVNNSIVAGRVSFPAVQTSTIDDSLDDDLPILPTQLSSEERILVDFDYLHLPQSLLSANAGEKPALLPAKLPAMDVSVESLHLGDRSVGRWSFLLTASDKTALLHRVEGQLQTLSITSELDDGLLWAVNADGNVTSSASLELQSDNFEAFLKTLVDDNTSLPMQSKKMNASLSLDWDGYPQDIALESTNGAINFDFEEGRFYKASESATGLMKLLGLINFDTLIRRVQLDFADVYKEGLGFDKIYGSVQLSDQVMSFYEPPVYFKGPSSEFKLSGEIDLGKNTIDANLVATLPVANNLPWVGALAGGLPGAAGAYVFTKMFGSQLEKLSSASYVIGGSLNDPTVEFDRLFENKNRRTAGEGAENSPGTDPSLPPTE